ncbi:SOS response-associated peptidase [Mariniplasma anaerobium]|uniref:Abasic site processing protein n=1 Tax=Mariniplasma anaerobium TaxID=2735436 RepID=A0A7U9XUR4_9MOLU|nr:SOS response-associated peptidase family protein [Mariniplasma anaerobium]BCR35848.1 putative SOS response-associated peptidase YoqW [Mariniplasma anaerobium]
MCGRFTITLTKEDFINYLSKYEDISINLDDFNMPNYNVAPSENIIAMIYHNKQYRVGPIIWGFIPSYAKDMKVGFNMINARSETLLEKKAFKDAFKSNRCVIFADSFYEWKKINGKKVPVRIQLKDQEVFAFAGLWSPYKDKEKTVYTATIITTKANDFMANIHDRMPVILKQHEIKAWLDSTTLDHTLYLKPYPSEFMKSYEVSLHVNHATHKDQSCINPIKNTY